MRLKNIQRASEKELDPNGWSYGASLVKDISLEEEIHMLFAQRLESAGRWMAS
jgi:hypothetical protein